MAFAELPPLPSHPKPLIDPETGRELTYRAQWARLRTREQLAKEINILQSLEEKPGDQPGYLPGLPGKLLGPGNWSPDNLPPRPGRGPSEPRPREYKLCIVGAGIAGLYIALILDTLAIPGVSFDFLEASNRIGGRCLTYNFSQRRHDYYDIGAMRFPKIKVMERTFDLFTRTGTNLVPYYLNINTVNCSMLFNNVRVLKAGNSSPDWSTNPFRVSDVSDDYAKKSPAKIMDEVTEEYIKALNQNPTTGFRKLMAVDNYSVREYLAKKTQYNNYRGIEYLETFAGSTTSFNSAFSEYVIDRIDFAAKEWWCVEGGTEELTKNVERLLQTKPQTNKKVTRIRTDGNIVGVNVEGESGDRGYDTVFCTPPLGCLQKMDLTGAQLNWGQKCAIRALTYGPATKIAIKFTRPWWITDCGITQAGVSSTDELIRTCVYPSYNLQDGADKPAVLLCSYCWRQDALRIGSMVRPDSPAGEAELKELVLRGLARLHNISYDVIAPLYMTHHGWNWHQDPNAMGAFAAFGPSDFSTLYPYLTRPAGRGLIHFAGEAISAHHAWIVGSLESAYRSVDRAFQRLRLWDARDKLWEQFGPAPGEMEDGDNGTEHLQTMLGGLSDAERDKLEEIMRKQEQHDFQDVRAGLGRLAVR
ncbi:hypothetical protein F4777DRAFT_573174 [Nemania sp. FL0916]|nr:hypothetical protein F4777DRAFT_573174 [Nemania sp. FL0916]